MMHELGILLTLASAAAAQGTDNPPQHESRYEAVIRAQYAAHTPAVPQRPEEAQRIYENYLKSIGRPTDKSANGADDNSTQPH